MLLLYKLYQKGGILYRKTHHVVCHRTCSDSKYVKIGNVRRKIFNSSSPELVPTGYLPKEYSPHLASHLQWIMKKDLLGQDIFLIGLPGPLRRQIVFQYLEMTNREVEYVVLSRDTTESDLKQRREILSGTAHYEDQSAVRAALEGRVLVLDGVEKAERNVLPILNNLLENREVQLEDGRFLVSAERYDKLLCDHPKELLDSWKLFRVSENFRVVALGLPVPQFRGNPLDPPFRSRFQAREIQPSFEEQLFDLSSVGQHIPKADLKNLLALCHTLLSSESNTLGIPRFPVENLLPVIHILNEIPFIPIEHAVNWLYPYKLFLSADGQKSVEESLKLFGFQQKKVKSDFKIAEKKSEEGKYVSYAVKFSSQGRQLSVDLPGSSSPQKDKICNYIPNKYHDYVLSELLQTHLAHDFCIVGTKGCGKSTLVKKFASLLNYSEEMVMLYRDMTSRDLLQQRITNEVGDTSWRPSQLVNGAVAGSLVILDGLHRLHPSTLSILQRLIHNRELQLYDGSRLLRHDRYDAIKLKYGLTDAFMSEKKVYRIHPSFRIIALAEPPKIGSSKDQWLTPELLSTFLFHSLRSLSLKEERYVIQQIIGPFNEKMETVLHFAHALRTSKDEALASIGVTLSTRQLTRIARRLSYFPHENIHSLISQACLMKFLPQLTRKAMEEALESSGIESEEKNQSCKQCKVEEGKLFLGNTCVPIYSPGLSKVKVPDILFYNNTEHMAVMEAMLQDFMLGEHLLLVGNQGVGKNKITDRFLQLLNRPREYVQLHRDTTVQSLTQQPTVVDGKIVYEDSPLVKAVQLGHVLVVDEADKAPTHVTCILKALVESGEMVLSDGRCIVHHLDPRASSGGNITMHPDFRMIVLANRPGFPFLGNDFFATLGDIFSCHAVDNPSTESEMDMLRKYGPDVPDYILMRLVKLFGELRSMSDQDLISYPYSTREVVNIVKHLQNFPEESLSSILRNVFDFDAFSKELQETLSNVFFKHGIPFGAKSVSVSIAKEFPLPKPQLTCRWIPEKREQIISGHQRNVKLTEPSNLSVSSHMFDTTEARCFSFSEQKYFWQLPLGENNIPLAIAASNGVDGTQSGMICVATANPISVFTSNFIKNSIHCLNLSGFFPPVRGAFKPEIKMVALTSRWNGWLLFHEGATNLLLLINPVKGNVIPFNLSSQVETAIAKISRTFKHEVDKLEMCRSLLKDSVVFYSNNGKRLSLINFDTSDSWNFDLPQDIKSACVVSESELLLTGAHDKLLAKVLKPGQLSVVELKETDRVSLAKLDSIISANQIKINSDDLCSVLNTEKGESGTLMTVSQHHAAVAVHFPQNFKVTEIYTFPRNTSKFNSNKSSMCILPKYSQVVRYIDREHIPFEVTDKNAPSESGFLEVSDLERQTCSYIPFPVPSSMTSYTKWLAGITGCYVLMCPSQDGALITVDAAGFVRVWETEKSSLQDSFLQWHKFVGTQGKDPLMVEFENNKEVTAPKHGKVDPTGAPHVGGNTWAGGTGGRDTAGLGGKGGPYRLDAGHTVYQLSDAEKNAVPPEVQRAAREMAQKAYKEKLREIEMSEYDAKLYEQFSGNIKKQVQMLRVMLDGLQAKSKERQWLKHQTSGELDDTRLIEGLTGEKSIYKRRGEQEPEMGSPQEKPKRLRLVVDVSGSMYRFNGHDSRLERQLESIVMLMEALDGYHNKFQYEIIGHSGEEFHLELSKFDNPPKNNKERLDILKKMYVHSQYCMSGDNTLSATKHAIGTITDEEADEYFVIVMSDANFDRYGISPQSFGSLLLSDPKVNSFAIFVGSLGNQAQMLLKALPAGRGFVCLDTKNLPQVLQQIFTSALLRESMD